MPTKKKRFPIYLTEYGYMIDSPAVPAERRIPEAKRARWLVQAWKIAAKTPRIKQMIHYDLVSQPPGAADDYFDLGLLTPGGDARTSYTSLRNWILEAVAAGKVAKQRPCRVCG